MPTAVLENKETLTEEILQLKEEKNALILAHNYQRAEVQDLADIIGDSLELSRAAAKTNNPIIVFCGVHFMAESASILSPDKTVLLPEITAGCPMADMITVEGPRKTDRKEYRDLLGIAFEFGDEFTLKDLKSKYPDAPVVCYVNTSAAVKAESDICCTSSNALKVAESLKEDTIIMVPDRNLSAYVAKRAKKRIITWDGFCHVHQRVSVDDINKLRTEHPDAVVIVHPECSPEIQDIADHIASTSGILRLSKEIDKKEFIIGTEEGLGHRLKKENPGKEFYFAYEHMVCPNMKRITLRSLRNALRDMQYVIKVPDGIRIKAKRSLDRMLEV